MSDFPMPDYIEPGTGKRMVWDSTSGDYVEAEEYEGTPSHASGGDFQATDPSVHRMTPKNPDATGILARTSNLDPDDTTTFIIAADYNADLGDELRQEVRMGHWDAERLREIALRHGTEFNGVTLDQIDWDHVGAHYEEEELLEDDQPVTMPNGVPQDWHSNSETPQQMETLVRNASISRCPQCEGVIGRDDHCVACGAAAPDFGSMVNQQGSSGPFPTSVPLPNGENTDRSFPTMSHVKDPDLWDVSSERPRGIMQLTSDNAPTLDACPECGDPMTVHTNDAVCHSCGHKQPVLRVEAAHRKQSWAFLAPLAMGVARAVGPKLLSAGARMIGGQAAKGGAKGALGGLGKAMGRGLAVQGGLGIASDLLGGGGEQPQAPVQNGPASTTVGSTGPGAGIGDLHGEDDNPEHDGTQGFAEEHSDSPEFNKDVNDSGGTSTGPDEDDFNFDGFEPVDLESMTDEDLRVLANLTPDQVEALGHVGVNWTLIKSFAEDAEADGSKNPVMTALDDMLEKAFPGYKDDGDKPEPKEASVDGLTKHAARLPRMCPHHKNLVQTALATGDPATALSAMAQHEYGEKSCNGSWEGDDGGCKYKPQMVTQTWWDEKAQKRQERAEQRQLDAQPLPADAEVPEQDELNDDRYEDDLAGETPTDGTTFEPAAEWGDQSVEVQHEGEQGAVMDFAGGDSAVGMGETDRQMAARVAGLEDTFPEGSKVHWKFYDRGVGTVVGHEANQFESSNDAVEVSWGDGKTERVYPGHLVPVPADDSQHPATGHEMQPDPVVPDHMPADWSDTPADQQGLVMNAHVEDFDFGTKLADKSEFEPASEHGNGHPSVKDESAVAGGDNPDIVDSNGETLRAGDSYLMRTPEYAVPDKVSIDNIDGDKITYTIHTDSIDYQDTMDLADMVTRGYEFEPDTGGDTPDPDAVDPTDFAPDPEATFGDDKGDIHKTRETDTDHAAVRTTKTADTDYWELVDTTDNDSHDQGTKAEMQAEAELRNRDEAGHDDVKANRWVAKPEGWSSRNYKGSSARAEGCTCDEDLCECEPKEKTSARVSSVQLAESLWHDLDPVAKTAGADYSPREQREFIHETGTARNLDRLDLDGTHYPQDDDLSDHFLLGFG